MLDNLDKLTHHAAYLGSVPDRDTRQAARREFVVIRAYLDAHPNLAVVIRASCVTAEAERLLEDMRLARETGGPG